MKILGSKDVGKVCRVFRQREEDYNNEEKVVGKILSDVKTKGDKALVSYSKKFDFSKYSASCIKLNPEKIESAGKVVSDDFIRTLKKAIKNITDFHRQEKCLSWQKGKNGSFIGQRVIPIEKAGVYVPGGKAPLCSTVLMNVIPAAVAGVEKIILCTPVDNKGEVNPYILAAADLLGIKEIYCLGGAQAIGAMAYGTETVPKVDKIVGPGNIYVALAKKMVFGKVGIDSFAGPSEILIIADRTANPKFIAADLLSQAEHDKDATSILITDSILLANQVKREIENQKQRLSRLEIIDASLNKNGIIFIVDNIDKAIELANIKAPEHLELMVKNPSGVLPKIKNAGAVFLGDWTPEAVGDYWAGPNHVLPTAGTARFSSALGVCDFVKRTNFMSYTKEELEKVDSEIIKIAEVEKLTAHANSVGVREI